MTHVLGFDHVQVAMPRGKENRARTFYSGLLGLKEIPKPGATAGRGGVWFQCGQLQLHLGIEEPFAIQRLVIRAVPEAPQAQQISLFAQTALYKK